MKLSITPSVVALSLFVGCQSTRHEHAGTARSFTDQVNQGKELFAAHCAKCHGDSGQGDEAPRLVGLDRGALPVEPPANREVRKSRFVTLGDVAEFAVHNMPPKKAGSLTSDQYLAVIAFAASANGVDAGPEPLTMARARTLTIPR